MTQMPRSWAAFCSRVMADISSATRADGPGGDVIPGGYGRAPVPSRRNPAGRSRLARAREIMDRANVSLDRLTVRLPGGRRGALATSWVVVLLGGWLLARALLPNGAP